MAAPDLVEDVSLNTPLTLRCGLTLPNRLVKAAMTEVFHNQFSEIVVIELSQKYTIKINSV